MKGWTAVSKIKESSLNIEHLKSMLDYDAKLCVFTWKKGHNKGQRAGTQSGPYRRVYINGELYLEHRLAVFYTTGAWPPELCDHEKGVENSTDLRNVGFSENATNIKMKSNNVSGVMGVHQLPSLSWRAKITFKGEIRNKVFKTFEEACAQRRAWESEVHGTYSRPQEFR